MEELEATVTRMKQSMRASAHHHEVNSKRMREKITKLENELGSSKDETQKCKAKC